ncbi:MAG: hypothetical protein KAI06_08700 [Anaerolineales bacterium]|nr:hypothetical protein [Anaerolineales bacterium]
MSQVDQDKKEKKAALKKLRNERKEWIRKASAQMKAQKKAIKAIKAQLQNDAGTVPLIAEATGIPADEILWYIAALKKYGQIIEGEKEGGYFRYVLVEGALEENSNNDLEESNGAA